MLQTPQNSSLWEGVFVLIKSLAEASFARAFLKTKIPQQAAGLICGVWRRKRDSNPRFRGCRTTVFKTAAFDHSAISPLSQNHSLKHQDRRFDRGVYHA
jgi:hypothetical protein